MFDTVLSLSDLSQKMLDAAKRAGADHADVVATQGTSINIEVLKGTLEKAERSEGIDLGLRVFKDGKMARCQVRMCATT